MLFLVAWATAAKAQHAEIDTEKHKGYYEDAYKYIVDMLEGDTAISFKNAVFSVENAYLGGIVNYDTFNLSIGYYAELAKLFADNSTLLYQGEDMDEVQKQGAIFSIMTAEEPIFLDSGFYLRPDPFTYDFEDFWGEKNWTKMFVTKLLYTHTGNCHSLPYLYKIIADELNVRAYLSMAPNHTYIKIRAQNPKIGWYNTELTNSTFPIDAWVKSSGYVHLDAIRNGLYMDTLSVQQEIAICLIDLAKGYEKLFNDLNFLLKCTDYALKYYPNYANAMLLKAETLKKEFERKMQENNARYAVQAFDDPGSKSLFDDMEALYFKLFKLGYRTMPKEMYINWLTDLKENKEKYLNKNIVNNYQTNEE